MQEGAWKGSAAGQKPQPQQQQRKEQTSSWNILYLKKIVSVSIYKQYVLRIPTDKPSLLYTPPTPHTPLSRTITSSKSRLSLRLAQSTRTAAHLPTCIQHAGSLAARSRDLATLAQLPSQATRSAIPLRSSNMQPCNLPRRIALVLRSHGDIPSSGPPGLPSNHTTTCNQRQPAASRSGVDGLFPVRYCSRRPFSFLASNGGRVFCVGQASDVVYYRLEDRSRGPRGVAFLGKRVNARSAEAGAGFFKRRGWGLARCRSVSWGRWVGKGLGGRWRGDILFVWRSAWGVEMCWVVWRVRRLAGVM